ncbi:CPBP family intramembrane glutamic endopeptidase [Halobaculum rarum]|uniref:CPBP family intramembrane glutamic endopeptidase n=1 Tax=Halobaculum rarum TaxID=3075122 RepID=UPI0032AFB8A6
MDFTDRSPNATFLLYTALTYGFSWSIWGLWAIVPDASSFIQTALLVLGTLGPFLAGLVLIQASDRSLKAWLAGIFRIRVPARYYVFALVLPVVVVLFAASFQLVLFDGEVALETVPRAIEYPLYLGFVLLFGGGLEEPGWRGYLLPRLQQRYSALTAALLIGTVWAIWHLPLFMIPNAVQSGLSPLLYIPQVLALSIILTWITNATDSSVLPAILLHSGGNAILNYYPIGGAAGVSSTIGLGLLVATLVVFAGVLVVLYGPKNLSPSDKKSTF